MTGERVCELCGPSPLAHLYDVDGYPIVRCRRCGLVFVGRAPDAGELAALYDRSYYENGATPGYAAYAGSEDRKRHHDRTLLSELGGHRAPGDLLEIGCAYGYFLDEARRLGWSVQGVEPSAHAADHARENFGLQVSTGPFVEMPVRAGSLDAIVLWDVIEHLPDPRRTLERAGEWLRPGGVVALSTGNVGSLAARLHGADWSLMAPPWHQFYFSPRTLRELLTRCGFDVLHLGGDGIVAVDAASARPRVPGALVRLLTATPVTRLARRLGAGSIMFAFARRRPA